MTDYISRENFLTDKRRLYCENCDRRKGTKNGKTKFVYEIGDAPCRSCGIGDVLDDVEEYPAADVAPVVHGRWKKNDNGTWSCGRCQSWIPNEQHYYARFCLYCGAKMDGGERDAVD